MNLWAPNKQCLQAQCCYGILEQLRKVELKINTSLCSGKKFQTIWVRGLLRLNEHISSDSEVWCE